MLKVLLLVLLVIVSSCKKSSGAICRDGTRSYSTGRGTCSWHGGVDHYVDTSEIAVVPTFFLVALAVFVLYFVFSNKK